MKAPCRPPSPWLSWGSVLVGCGVLFCLFAFQRSLERGMFLGFWRVDEGAGEPVPRERRTVLDVRFTQSGEVLVGTNRFSVESALTNLAARRDKRATTVRIIASPELPSEQVLSLARRIQAAGFGALSFGLTRASAVPPPTGTPAQTDPATTQDAGSTPSTNSLDIRHGRRHTLP